MECRRAAPVGLLILTCTAIAAATGCEGPEPEAAEQTGTPITCGAWERIGFYIGPWPPNRAQGRKTRVLEDVEGRSVTIEETPVMTGADVAGMRAVHRAAPRELAVEVEFASAERFFEVTSTNIGNMLAVVIDDTVVVAPIIRTPIENGLAYLPLAPQATSTQAYAKTVEQMLGCGRAERPPQPDR